jgi:transposase
MKFNLRYEIRRIGCVPCGTVKTEAVPWARPSSNFTRAFEERAAYLAQQSSKTAVVNLMRITWRTVGWIIERVVTSWQNEHGDSLEGLRVIGVDELSYRRHHKYVTVVVDHEKERIIWASEGKSAKTLTRFFDELGEERCALLEAVTIDMSQAYIKAVTKATPGAQLIFDRFHVQRLAHIALDETRRDEVRKAITKDDKKSLKKTRVALQRSPWNLTDRDKQTLNQLAETNLPIYYAHLLKDDLAAILAGRQVNVARSRLKVWIDDAKKSDLPHFKKLAETISKHIDGILGYVRTRLNNGRVEGLNSKIRTITRRSYGFHSAYALIALIFLCCGGIHLSPAHSIPKLTH